MTSTVTPAPAGPDHQAGRDHQDGPVRPLRPGHLDGLDDPRPAVRAEAERLAASGTGRPGPYLIGVRHHAPSLSAVLPALLDAVKPEVVLVELPTEFQPWLGWLADEDTQAPGAPGVADALRHRLTGRDSDDDLWDRLVETAAPGSTPDAVRRAALLVGWALRRDAETGPGVDPYDLRREAWMRARIRAAAAGGRRVAAVVGAFHAPALLDGPAATEEPPHPDHLGHALSLIPYTYPLLDARSGYPAGIRDPEWQHTVLDAGGDPDRLTRALTTTAVRICEALRSQDHPSGPADAREIVRLAGDLARLRGHAAPGRGELVEAVQTVLAQGEPLGRGRAVARALERVLVGTRTGRATPAAPRSGLAPAVEALLADLGLPGPADPEPRELRLDPLRTPLDRRREILLHRLTACGVPYADPVTTTGAGGTEAIGTRWRLHWTPAAAAMLTVAGARGVTPAQAAEGTQRGRRRREQQAHGPTAPPVRQRHTHPAARGRLGPRAAAGCDPGGGPGGPPPAAPAPPPRPPRLRREQQADGPTAREVLQGLTDAAACGLPALADTRLTQLATVLPSSGTLPELLDALALLDRLAAGHLPGYPPPDVPDTPGAPGALASSPELGAAPGRQEPAHLAAFPDGSAPLPGAGGASAGPAGRLGAVGEVLTVAAVRQLEGLGGSDDPADARALVELARRADLDGGLRLGHVLAELADRGSPLVRGAAGAVRVLLGRERAEALGGRAASWVDGATGPEARHALGRGLVGLLTAAEGLFATAPEALEPVLERITSLPDAAFLDRLPALRGGFDTLSPAARDRLLLLVEERLGTRLAGLPEEVPPAVVAGWVRADLAARAALARRGLLPEPGGDPASEPPHRVEPLPSASVATRHALAPAERWRLLLGRPGSSGLSGRCARLATALDELYGSGRGEGSGPGLDGRSGRGGREAPFPGVREWAEELSALFGPGVREEVLAAAVAQGRTDVLEAIEPGAVRPSVDLLRTVLEHAGGLPEARVARLRPLVRRLVDELTRALATRLRPALTGIRVPRPTRRPGGGLDLDRTIRANLATARPSGDGGTLIVPERPVFRTRARQAADWRLILVVDVSGSMEASTVWAALTASILAGVPSLSTHFVAFSTEIVDLTERVEDPLSVLLEVRIGGGTSIAGGLRYARKLVTVPSRTLVVVVSDFEEGGPVGGLLAQTRALVDSGVHLLGCAALDDTGTARYSKAVAGQLVAAGMPVAALSPLELARWVGEKVR
ncbi:DUF5682 family protein [Kitasatospora sp. NPDC059811]|uniref:DUF5682 family protein n=1 Tax=Kitasatospora sp. NPDC059811 TaxID=3346957 RepID=UPI003645F8E7